MRVGRDAIDDEAMRLLEEHNPDVDFDWGRLLKAGAAGSTGSASAGSSRERREERRDERRPRGGDMRSPAAAAPIHAAEAATDRQADVEASETADLEPGPAADALEATPAGQTDGSRPPEPPPEPDEPVAPRYVRLGADGLRRLRARYADLKARLEAKPLEEPERAELFGRVERLNPDAWQTDEDVAHAIEEYEVVYESFRPVVGRPPRRRRP